MAAPGDDSKRSKMDAQAEIIEIVVSRIKEIKRELVKYAMVGKKMEDADTKILEEIDGLSDDLAFLLDEIKYK